jgi:hypothetical protein
MNDSLIEIAQDFFSHLQSLPKGREELSKFDQKVEFVVPDDKPFTLEVKGGAASVRHGVSEPEDMKCIRLTAYKDVLVRLFTCRLRFTDAYTHMADRDPEKAKKHLYAREQPGIGGTEGGVLLRWIGRLVRIGQELT